MKNSTLISLSAASLIGIGSLLLINRCVDRVKPEWLQGTVAATTYRASSKVAGRIDRLTVREGDRVEQGSLLYTLTTPELEAKLMQAEAVERAAAAMDQKALHGARPQQKSEALNLWKGAEAALLLAQKSYERTYRLYEAGVATAQQFDEAEAALRAAKASEQAAHAQYELVESGAEPEEKKAAAARVEQAAGAVTEVESLLRDAWVYAPISGEVSTLQAEVGELVGSGYPVVMIIDMADQWVEFNIREDLLPKIRMGKLLKGYVPALGRDLLFRISYMAPEADFATWTASRASGDFDIRTFQVKARPLQPEEGLRPGMSVLVDWRSIE